MDKVSMVWVEKVVALEVEKVPQNLKVNLMLKNHRLNLKPNANKVCNKVQKEQRKVKPMQKKPQARVKAAVKAPKEAVRVQAKALEAEKEVALVLEAEVEKALEKEERAKALALAKERVNLVKVQEKVKANHREVEKETPLKMATHLTVETNLRTLNKQRKPLKKQLMGQENAAETVILINLMK